MTTTDRPYYTFQTRDMELLALAEEHNAAFWRMIRRRRKQPTISHEELDAWLALIYKALHEETCQEPSRDEGSWRDDSPNNSIL